MNQPQPQVGYMVPMNMGIAAAPGQLAAPIGQLV